ncbi:MAG: hypothetical protein KDD66_10555 [Bdellovibrionales bacterium]|nr:hypothetical protein [Bdellovibrionales bacterium]
MDSYYVWQIISFSWTEVGIEYPECQELVEKAQISIEDLPEVDRIYFRDVCASFAPVAILGFPLWMFVIPDWGYGEEDLRERMERWYKRPYFLHFLNPLRVLGYPIALLMSWGNRSKLRRAVIAKTG